MTTPTSEARKLAERVLADTIHAPEIITEALQAAEERGRQTALEEAAVLCSARSYNACVANQYDAETEALECSESIRALKQEQSK